MAKLEINQDRLNTRLKHIASFTVPGRPWERTAFSELHKEAREWLAEELRTIGLDVVIDDGGNLIGTLPASSGGLAPIAIGSHSDTVPSGGRYDGVAGVIVAVEIAQCLQEAGQILKHPFQVIDFLAEEPNRYGISCVGSRAMVGELTPEILRYSAPDGSSLADGIREMGGNPDRLVGALRARGNLAAFLEMHIEQARVLEDAGEDIGSVTVIAGIIRVEVIVSGIADHAGATPMTLRKDALAATAQMLLAIEERANLEVRAPLVATVGRLRVWPNAANAVPGKVTFTLEIRSGDNEVLSDFLDWSLACLEEIGQQRALGIESRVIGKSEPSVMASEVHDAILDAARAAGCKSRSMPSGAGHDAAYLARIVPTGMIFIPCLEGRSHCPEEYATPEQVALGAQVTLDALIALDETLR